MRANPTGELPEPALTEAFLWRGATVRWGTTGAGPPVVLCHGTPWSSFVWRHAIESLAQHRHVFFWDMIGYGSSDKAANVSIAEQSELLAALIQHWGLQRPDVVSHDIGGAVALRAHLLHGVAIASLALVDVVVLRPWGSPFFRLVADNAEVFAQLPSRLHAALVAEYIRGASQVGLDPGVLERLVAPWLDEGHGAFYRQIAQADERHTAEIEPLLASIEVPTLIVWGAQDEWIPVEQAHRLVDVIAHSELMVIDGAGHLIVEDAADALNAVLDDWLNVTEDE